MKKVFKLLMGKTILLFCLATLMSYFSCSNDNDGENQPQIIPLKVKLNETSLTMQIGETYVLQPIVESGDIETDKINWNSSNPDVATVVDGVVNAISEGEASITLAYKNDICASCTIKVLPISPTSISLNYHNLTMQIGDCELLSISVEPANVTDITIKWESSDTNIAVVNADGIVTAISVGEATIKAIVDNSEIYDQCNITVTPIHVTGINCQESTTILQGSSIKVEAIVIPENATDTSIIWYSLNPEIAVVDENGVVTGISQGRTNIIAKTADGGFEGVCQIEVCDISTFVTAIATAGIEGSTSSYFYSYLHFSFNTNINSSVILSSVKLYDNYGEMKSEEYPNITCSKYSYKFITAYHGNSIGNTFMADGWKFVISYIWNGKNYELIYIHSAWDGWF